MTLCDFDIAGIISCDEMIEQKIGTSVYSMDGEAYDRPSLFYLDDLSVAEKSREYFDLVQQQHNCQAKNVRLIRLSEAIVVGQGAVITSDKRLVFESVAEFLNHRQMPHGLGGTVDAMKVKSKCVDTLIGNTVLVKRPWYRNYGHFIVDLLPILSLLRDTGVRFDHIIFGDIPDGNLKAFMMDAKNFAYPWATIKFSNDKDPIFCSNLYYMEPVHVPPLFKHPAAMRAARRLAFDIYGSGKTDGSLRIYLSRSNVGVRDIENSPQIERILRDLGFVIVYPEKMTLLDQIAMFQKASYIVGPKGAALTNMIFSRPGTHVLSLSSSEFVDPFFWDLASQFGIKFSEIYGVMTGDDPSSANFTIDHKSLTSYTQKIGLDKDVFRNN